MNQEMGTTKNFDPYARIESNNSGYASANIGTIDDLQKAYALSDKIDDKNSKKMKIGLGLTAFLGLVGGCMLGFGWGAGAVMILAGFSIVAMAFAALIYSLVKADEYRTRSIETAIDNRQKGIMEHIEYETEAINKTSSGITKDNAEIIKDGSGIRKKMIKEDYIYQLGLKRAKNMATEFKYTKGIKNSLTKEPMWNMDSVHLYYKNRLGNSDTSSANTTISF